MQGVETLGKNIVKTQQRSLMVSGKEIVHQMEAMVVIQNVQVLKDIGVIHLRSAESHRLVEDSQGVTHGAVGLEGNHMEGLVVDGDIFLGGDVLQVPDYVRNADAAEVVGLAAAQDGWQNLMLLCGGKDENGVCRRFLQSLKEGVEGRLAEHVDLVYDKHAVFSNLRGNVHLVDEHFNVVHAVVGGGVQLMNAV